MRKQPHLKSALTTIFFLGLCPLVYSQQTTPPEKVVGRDQCAQCHVSETKAWEKSSHNLQAWSLLEHTKAAEFAKAIGVTNIMGDSACTKCHGTHQSVDGQLAVLKGNSCESCHGGAGGTNGWLKTHYDFGVGGEVASSKTMVALLEDRLKETPEHRSQRDASCEQSGMIRSNDPVGIARNCLNCHLVPNEALIKAGHPISSKFDLVEWLGGEVRHNFLLTPDKNSEAPTNWTDAFRNGEERTATARKRLLHVAGKLADLEISLRLRATVTSVKRGTLGDELNDRIDDLQDDLGDLEIASLEPVLEAAKVASKRTLKKIQDNDKATYTTIADNVAAATATFIRADPSGSKLPDIKIRDKVIGEVYGN